MSNLIRPLPCDGRTGLPDPGRHAASRLQRQDHRARCIPKHDGCRNPLRRQRHRGRESAGRNHTFLRIYLSRKNHRPERLRYKTLTYPYDIPSGAATHLGTVLEAYNTVFKLPVLGGDPITAKTITLDAGTLRMDFTQSIYGNYGSGTEAALIENLFWAYFKNMPEVEKIYISVEGSPYETGHIMFALDEAILRQVDASSAIQ